MANQNSIADLSTTPASNTNWRGQSIVGSVQLVLNLDEAERNISAMLAAQYDSLGGSQTAGGTATALTVTITEDWAGLAHGQILAIKVPSAATGASTLVVTVPTAGALASKKIRRRGDSVIQANDWLANDTIILKYDSAYDTAAGAFVLLNPAVPDTSAFATINGKLVAVLSPLSNRPPSTNYATLDTRNSIPVLEFDTTTQEAAVWGFQVPSNYPGNGLVVTFWAAADTAITGTIGFDGAFETDNGLDLDADSFASAQTFTAATVSGTSGIATKFTLTFSNSQIDGLAANDAARFRLRRDVANDTAAGDAQFVGGVIEFA